MTEPSTQPEPEVKANTHLTPERALEEPSDYTDSGENPETQEELEPVIDDGAPEIKVDEPELEEGEIIDDDVDAVMLKYKYHEGELLFAGK